MEHKINQFLVDSTLIFESLSSNSDDYIYIWDYQNGNYITSDNLAQDFTIASQGADFVDVWQAFVHEQDLRRVRKSIQLAVEQHKKKIVLEYQVTNAKGEHLWLSDKATIRYNDTTGIPEIIIGVMHNLLYDGTVDFVTGLLMHAKCKEIFDVLKRNRLVKEVCAMLIGIDEFASINTLHDHNFGDLVLRKSAQDFLNLLYDGCTMYRYDGDQLLIVSDKCSKKELMELYERLKAYTARSHRIDGVSYRFSISAGIASYPQDATDWVSLEKAVSIALKNAKQTGKNQCSEFSSEVFEEALYEQSLTRYLADSVEHEFMNFHVVYQPVCHTRSLKIKGAEILLRYKTPNGEAVFPDSFIPLLEQSRLIIPVGLWVLEQAIRTTKKWLEYIDDFVMNVNVSYIQFREASFCDHLERLLKEYDLDASHITLELTESYFISDADRISASMRRLRKLHVKIAMDDFGTGYSSLARLAEFNVDIVKIDRSFVQSLHKSKYNHDFVDSVVRLCHNVGMKVCVEGVETKDEQEIIYVLNADFVQGYYVSRPILEDDFFESFISNPHANESLVVIPNTQLQRDQLVSDNDVLTAMLDATPLGLNFWNRDLEIIACNNEIISLFNAEDLKDVQSNFDEFSPEYQPDGTLSREKAKEIIDDAFNGKEVHTYWEHCNRQKEFIPAEVSAVRIPYMDDYIVASYTRDMRSQRNMEEKIEQFNARFKAILDSNPLCLNLWNRNFQNIMCNTAAVELFGLKNQNEYLECFFELSPQYQPDGSVSSELAVKYITEAFETGYCKFEWMHCTLDGKEIPAEITLVKIEGLDEFGNELVAGYTRDLREQIMMEEKIEKFNTRLEAILDSSPLCLNLWNRKFENIMCNKAAVSLFNLRKPQEYLDRFFELSPEYQPDGTLSSEKSSIYINKAFKDGFQQFNWMHCDLNGNQIPAEITLVRIEGLDEDGGDLVAGYTRDLRTQLEAQKLQNMVSVRMRAVLDSSPIACILWSSDFKIIDCNQVMLHMLGVKSPKELSADFDVFMPKTQPDGSNSIEKKSAFFKEIMQKHTISFEWVYIDKEKQEVPCEVTIVRISLEDEDILVSYSRDLRELHRTLELNERLSQMAYYDLLTGVTSRARFMERLSSVFTNAKNDKDFAIIFFDIDYFKTINDTYGHVTGDLVLKRVVKMIEKMIPNDAVIGRYGGDEFIILLERISEEHLTLFMTRIVKNISQMTFLYEGVEFSTSISMGGTFNRLSDETYQTILNRADKALYKAKDKGRNGYELL
ncbi:EAL domain-containing protein [Amedibacillus sp. YH-ame10]